MFMILLAVMAGATPGPGAAAVEPPRDIQQVAIDTITNRSEGSLIQNENRGELRISGDPQVEIANRILGRNVTYPITSEQSAKPFDLQSAIANSISGRP